MIESSDRMNVEFDRSLRALMTGKNDSCGTIEHEQVNEDQSSRSRDRSSGTDPLERVILNSYIFGNGSLCFIIDTKGLP